MQEQLSLSLNPLLLSHPLNSQKPLLTYIFPGIIGIIVSVFVVGALLALLMLRKRP